MPIALEDLRRFAVARSLFTPTTLKRALHRLGFVQADPIRAPARPRDWLGQPLSEERRARVRARLRRVASTARSRVQARARGGAGSHASLSGPRIVTVRSEHRRRLAAREP